LNVFEFLAIAILILSIAVVVGVDRVFGARRLARQNEAMLIEQHIEQLQQRIAELERHNDDLRQQLEWNKRLLEAQDRVLQQLPPAVTR
jgi:Tfp pilus assembly protein PilN